MERKKLDSSKSNKISKSIRPKVNLYAMTIYGIGVF